MQPSAASKARLGGPRPFRWSIRTLQVSIPRRPAVGALDGCTSCCDGCPAPLAAPAQSGKPKQRRR